MSVQILSRFRAHVLLFVGLVFVIGAAAADVAPTRWMMLHVQGPIGQADCHLVTLPDGRHVLVDAGEAGDAPGAVVSQLQRQGVTRIALAVISHFHGDHYARLLHVLDAGITIDRVIVNVPVQRVADRELPWGCHYDDVLATLAALRDRGVPYETPRAGDRLIEGISSGGIPFGLDVICAYDGVNTPIGETDVNDTSIILRLFHGTTRVLFTGDLNHALGAYLAASGADIRADILKAPHHGTEGCAPNEFFDRVGASAVLVPSPTALWLSQRSSRTRTYFGGRGIPTLVNGLHGIVSVWLSSDSYRIESEIRGFAAEIFLPPSIVLPPVSAEIGTGANLTLSITATGSPAPSVQWHKDGTPIVGAIGPTLTLLATNAGDAGAYTATAINAHGEATSQPAVVRILDTPSVAPTTGLVNLSARGWVGSGDATMVAGFVIGGQGSKSLLVRAVGPSLAAFGVDQSLPDPRLSLTTGGGRLITDNDDWSATTSPVDVAAAATRIGAFALESGSKDSALLLSLPPGNYTALARDATGEPGVALIELYDLDPTSAAHLINLSARSWAGGGDAPLIAGFVTEGTGSLRVLCRAVGPSLSQFGITEFMPDPRLALHRGGTPASAASVTPDAVSTAAEITLATSSVGAFGLLAGERDIATLLTLSQGLRTAVLSSGDATAGIALVEIYLVP